MGRHPGRGAFLPYVECTVKFPNFIHSQFVLKGCLQYVLLNGDTIF